MDKKVVYRPERDILYVNMGERVKETVPKGGFNIDLSHDGKIVGVEILDASEVIGDVLDEDVSPILENLEDADVLMKEHRGMVFMVLKMYADMGGTETERAVSLELPQPQAAT
ncbi:MAG: DUF2283 domain-containing protein [Candidatus Nanohaloarchaea archaeon]|nr:DUF2283 domain-containing protein [Candidatus Nanohaloarchaea archaeon]